MNLSLIASCFVLVSAWAGLPHATASCRGLEIKEAGKTPIQFEAGSFNRVLIERARTQIEKSRQWVGEEIQFGLLLSALENPALHTPEGIAALGPELRDALVLAIKNLPLALYRSILETGALPVEAIDPSQPSASRQLTRLAQGLHSLESAMLLLSTVQAASLLHADDPVWKGIETECKAGLSQALGERLQRSQIEAFQMDLISGRKDLAATFLRRELHLDLLRIEKILDEEFRPGNYFDLVAAAESERLQDIAGQLREVAAGTPRVVGAIRRDLNALKAALANPKEPLGVSIQQWPLLLIRVNAERNGTDLLRRAINEFFESLQEHHESKEMSELLIPGTLEGKLEFFQRLRDYAGPDPGGVIDRFQKARKAAEKTYLNSLFDAVKADDVKAATALLAIGAYPKQDLKYLRYPKDRRRTLRSMSHSAEMAAALDQAGV